MIMDSSLEIIKKEGIENLNVRNIATKLNCSTQPIMYHYKNMDILKDELYKKVDEYHSNCLMKNSNDDPLLSIEKKTNLNIEEIKEMFTILFITVHGIASLLANNSIAYDENHFKKILETSFNKVNK